MTIETDTVIPSNHYLDKKEFSKKVIEYTKLYQQRTKEGHPPPQITHYLGKSILDLCINLGDRYNFARYTYKDEMVMDAVENCVRVLGKAKFNEFAETSSGTVNAFGYFSRIAFRAMVRRLQKENKEWSRRMHYLEQAGISDFVQCGENYEMMELHPIIDGLKGGMYLTRISDEVDKEFELENKRNINV